MTAEAPRAAYLELGEKVLVAQWDVAANSSSTRLAPALVTRITNENGITIADTDDFQITVPHSGAFDSLRADDGALYELRDGDIYTIIYRLDSASARQLEVAARRADLVQNLTDEAAQVAQATESLSRGINSGFEPLAIDKARETLAQLEAALAAYHAELDKKDRR